jgi:hypothetical protein
MHGRLALSVHSHFDSSKILGKWFSCNDGFVIVVLEWIFGKNFDFGGGRGGRQNVDFVAWRVRGKGDKSGNGFHSPTLPLWAWCNGCQMLQMLQVLQLHQMHQSGAERRRSILSFLSSIEQRNGAGKGECYKCTSCYSCTNCTKGVQGEEEVSFLFFLLLSREMVQFVAGVTNAPGVTVAPKSRSISCFVFLTLKLFYYNYLKIHWFASCVAVVW